MSILNFRGTLLPWRVRPAVAGDFLVIMAQGRSGSTLLLRMLNACPGVRISGENRKAIDHLRAFVDCFQYAENWNKESDFCRQAWKLPCPLAAVQRRTTDFLLDLYNPGRSYRVAGFKEIRYGRDYDELATDVTFLRDLIPNLKIIFNTRQTDTAVKSSFWEDTPDARQILDTSYDNFLRYHRDHPDFTYHMPFEELREGAPALQGMFDFLGLPFTRAAHAQLAVKLR